MGKIDRKGVIHGGVSNIVYRYYRGQQIVQLKSKRKVKQSAATKEAGLEFGLCASTARVIREAFSPAFKGYDGPMINRFNSLVQSAVRSCNTKERCERTLHDGDLSYLRGFQFNNNSPLDKVLKARPEASLEDGQVYVSLPAFSKSEIKGIKKAEHFFVRFLLVSFDFEKKVYSYVGYKEIRIDKNFEGGRIALDCTIPGGRIAMLSMSIHAYKRDGFDGTRTLNSVDWSPAEMIGAWHIAEVEDQQLPEPVEQSFVLLNYDYPIYEGIDQSKWSNLFEQKEKRNRKKEKRQQDPPKETTEGFNLPQGDISF